MTKLEKETGKKNKQTNKKQTKKNNTTTHAHDAFGPLTQA